MSEREGVERTLGRIYKHHLKTTGRLPNDAEVREMELKALGTAESVERKKAEA